MSNQTVNSLQQLLEQNYDAEEGYKEVLLKAKHPKLNTWIMDTAALRSKFVPK